MSQKILPTTMNPEIRISQILGDLRIAGWGESQVSVEADLDDLCIEVEENVINLSCSGDCSLRVPQPAALHIDRVHGDTQLKLLDEQITIQEVFGSLSMHNLAGASLGIVHGDLSAQGIRGNLLAEQVFGETHVRNIRGMVDLNQVLGNLDLREAGADVEVNARGNARLRISQLTGTRYAVRADGNVHCHIPEDASLTAELSSREKVIRIKMPQETKTVRDSHAEVVLGGGEKRMVLEAGGVLYLFGQSFDWGETGFPNESPTIGEFDQRIAQQVQEQIESQLEAINRQVSDQIAAFSEQVSMSNLPPDQVQRLIEQARMASERKMERSQEKILRTQKKIEQKLEAASRRRDHVMHSHRRRSWNFDFSARKQGSTAATEVATDEERLMILRMLEQKKINPDEAERLLSALEGK